MSSFSVPFNLTSYLTILRELPQLKETKEVRGKDSKKDMIIETETRIAACDCMATKHTFLTSCIGCGKIFCERVSIINCSFCNQLIFETISADDLLSRGVNDEGTIKAYKQKDKLLLFDRESTKRTHVYDAQGDYYESAAWLSEKEKLINEKKEKSRRDKLHRRRYVQSIDINLNSMVISATRDVDTSVEEDNFSSVETPTHLLTFKANETYNESSENAAVNDESGLALSIENYELSIANNKAGSVYRAIKKSFAEKKCSI